MAFSFPIFYGKNSEDAVEFMENLEMAHLISGRDDEPTKLRAFPLVVKGEACSWYNALGNEHKGTWEVLKHAFMRSFGAGETPENLWEQLS